MPKCWICEATINSGRYCKSHATLATDESLHGRDWGYAGVEDTLSVEDLQLARDDYEYQAEHADDVQEREFLQRQADQLQKGIESLSPEVQTA